MSDTTELDAGATLRAASESGDALLYAFSQEAGGFVIASGDERAHAVLGYSTEKSLDEHNLPEGLRAMLRQYAVEIATLRAEGETNESEEELSYDPAWTAVAPMITSDWGQRDPYNRQAPISETGSPCLTGCPSTMLAQLMDYYQYQNWKVEEETWHSGVSAIQIDRDVTVRFDSPVNWSLLRRSYNQGEFTEAEANEVAKLMKYTGAAMHIEYGSSGSGVNPNNVLDNIARVADYGLQATYAMAWQYTLRTWSEKLYKQLAAGRPMPYASMGGGHTFLMDGYAGEGYFHFNWGWNGLGNGNYLLSALLTEFNMHLYQVGIFDCCPASMQPINEEPVLLKSVDLDLSGETPAFKLVLASIHSGVQTGQMRLVLVDENGNYPFLSDAIDFTFTPDANHASDTISVPFPEYAKLTEELYAFLPLQRSGEEWTQIQVHSASHYQVVLLKTDDQYSISYEPVALTGTLVNPPSQISLDEETTLTLDVKNAGKEMATATFIATFYNDEQSKSFTLGTALCELSRQLVEFKLRVIDLPVGKYKMVLTGGGVSTDPIDVELVRNSVLVITEVPTISDIQVSKVQRVTYKVKNIGPNPFAGTLNFALAITDDPNGAKVAAARHQEVEIAVDEEVEVQWSFSLFGKYYNDPHTGYCLMYQSGAWLLNRKGETDSYRHPVIITPKATANEEIDAPETTISWQGRTLCVESAQPLKAYHIYKVNGEAVATGSISGTSARIDGSAWPTGVYVLAIETTDGKTRIYKILL